MNSPDILHLKPSIQLMGLVTTAHLVAAIGVICSGLELALKLALLLAFCLYFFICIRRFVLLLAPESIRELRWTEDHISLRLADGRVVDVEVKGEMLVTFFVTVVNFKVLNLEVVNLKGVNFKAARARDRFPLILFNDSGDQDLIRRFRVWCRFGYPLNVGGTKIVSSASGKVSG